MSEDEGATTSDLAYTRPNGVGGGFAPRDEPEPYHPPPPTVSPQEQAIFSRPPGADSFAPAPGERIAPRHAAPAPVPPGFAAVFGPSPQAQDGFAPAEGDRLPPSGPAPESPWWKPDARRDPWRDPGTAFWLGRGAVFTRGRPAQLDAAEDIETDEFPDPADVPAGEEPAKPAAVRRLRLGPRTWVLAVLLVLVAGAVGGGSGWWLTRTVHDALHRPDISIAQVETPTERAPGSIASVAKRVGPAVVSIAVSTDTGFDIGSGVVIDRDGDVLTNNHVIAPAVGGQGVIVVTFSNEATAKATIVGRDPTSDLAVIKVPNDQLTVAQLGDSDKLAVGDPVIAIGSPLGLQGTVTSGIVSALNRPVHAGATDGSDGAYLDAIQTDAAINPGNSGGALLNAGGAVIGINSAGRFTASDGSGGQIPISGIGYAIPINYARTIALELIHTGKAVHATLGVQGVTALAGQQVGAYLKQIAPNSAAAKAGLALGDVVVAADGQLVQSFEQLVVIVQQHKPGDRISLTYYPKGSATTVTKTVTLG